MAPGGAHPRCALGGRGSGPLPRQLPGGSRNSGLGGRAALGQPRPGGSGCRGHFAAGSAGRPAREGRPLSRRTLANRLGPESGPLATASRLREPGLRLSGPPGGGRALPRGVVLPKEQRTWDRGPCEGPRLAWSGLVCCASRGGARGQPSCHSALLFGPREPDRGESSGARLPGVRHPARRQVAGLRRDLLPQPRCRPSGTAPLRGGPALSAPPGGDGGSGSCYRQGRTG